MTRRYSTLLIALLVLVVVVAAVAVIVIGTQRGGHGNRLAFSLGPAAFYRAPGSHGLTANTGTIAYPSHFDTFDRHHYVKCGRKLKPEVQLPYGRGWQERYAWCLLREAGVWIARAYPHTTVTAPHTPIPATPRPAPLYPTAPPPTRVIPTATPLVVNVPTYSSGCAGGNTLACAEYLVSLMNAERQQAGERPLSLSAVLSNGSGACIGAIGHATHMATVGTISHDQFPTDVCGSYFTAGENVGVASTGSILNDLSTIHQQMKGEPWVPGCSGSHHCNYMQPSFNQVGIGIAAGSYAGFTAYYLSEEFTN